MKALIFIVLKFLELAGVILVGYYLPCWAGEFFPGRFGLPDFSPSGPWLSGLAFLLMGCGVIGVAICVGLIIWCGIVPINKKWADKIYKKLQGRKA